MNRRSKLLIEPRFQLAFILKLSGWIILSTVLTAALFCLVVFVMKSRLAGDFFYISPVDGTHPVWVSLWRLMLPALALCLPLNLALTIIFALYYSQKLAGPVHRLGSDMLKVARGDKVRLHFQLRESDELQEVAHAFDALLKSLAEKGYAKDK